MADSDLRKINRKELLELLIASEKENDQLKERLQQQAVQLQSRDLQIKNAGSIAEAALVLNGVFESADKAAAQYLESIKGCAEQQESAFDRIVAEAEERAKAIIDSAEKEKQRKKREADAYARKLSARIEAYFKAHPGLYEQMKADEKK